MDSIVQDAKNSVLRAKRYLLGITLVFVVMCVYVHSNGDGSDTIESQYQAKNTIYAPPSFLKEHKDAAPQPETPPEAPLKHKHRLLLLVTKPRSGSSYTSALIANHSSVFYTFEPLHQILPYPTFVNKSNFSHREMAWSVLKSYFACNVKESNLNLNALSNSLDGKRLKSCRKKTQKGEHARIDCHNQYLESCRAKDIIFLKIVRPPLSWIEQLLWEFPNLKILYLIRDPRAELYSRSFGNNLVNWNDITFAAKHHCEDITQDINNVAKFKTLFPGRVKVIRYENGVDNPTAYAKNIYQFTGLKFTEQIRNYISLLKTHQKYSRMSLFRDNATKSLFKWRHTAQGFRAAQVVDTFCAKFYAKMGYFKVGSKEEMESEQNTLFVDSEEFLELSRKLGG